MDFCTLQFVVKPPAVFPDMGVKAPKNDQFPTGLIRVSESGAKGWEMIDFTQVLPRFWITFWVLLTKWRGALSIWTMF